MKSKSTPSLKVGGVYAYSDVTTFLVVASRRGKHMVVFLSDGKFFRNGEWIGTLSLLAMYSTRIV